MSRRHLAAEFADEEFVMAMMMTKKETDVVVDDDFVDWIVEMSLVSDFRRSSDVVQPPSILQFLFESASVEAAQAVLVALEF